MRRSATAFLVIGLLGGCGSAPPPAKLQDQNLQRYERAGQLAYSLDRPQEAVTQYRLALAQAEARDDATAIGNLSFNLAVAELRANQATAALMTARRARAELIRRGGTAFPDLDLVEATALYRTGDLTGANAMAARLQNDGDWETAAAASFLRGLIADDRHDAAGLAAASAALAHAMTLPMQAGQAGTGQGKDAEAKPEQRANALELQARLARQNGEFDAARTEALQAADLRRDLLDYRGLARALSVAADAARQAGDMPAAADLYLRAGRSAAIQGDPVLAKPWLDLVIQLSKDPALTEAAQRTLADLAQNTAQ